MILNLIYKLLCLLCIIEQRPASNLPYRLYHSDRTETNDLQYDCLLFDEKYLAKNYNAEKDKLRSYQIIPYCIRPSDSDFDVVLNSTPIELIHGTSITFEQLRNQNYTSEDLYLSSTPVDIVEQYQEYLDTLNNSLSIIKIYNCTSPWFGEYCQYTFNSTLPFNRIVTNYFDYQLYTLLPFARTETCYIFLQCDRGLVSICLDWREICDGKIDCVNGGKDEISCEDVEEVAECKNDEFRCGDGLCIPNDFFNDDVYNPDCLDRSDERDVSESPMYLYNCIHDPAFRCEETACRNEHEDTCSPFGCAILVCTEERRLLREAQFSSKTNSNLSFDCWTSLICLTVYHIVVNIFDEINCPMANISKALFQASCPHLFFFPEQPILLNHVRLVYGNNFINNTVDSPLLLPYYICYDERLCDFLPPSVSINGSSCRLLSEINLDGHILFWVAFEKSLFKFFQKCLGKPTNHTGCPKSKPYRCANSSKCLSLNRLLDGIADCFLGDDERINNSCSLPDQRYRFRCLTEDKCISVRILRPGLPGCPYFQNPNNPFETLISNQMQYPPTFPLLCNGFIQYSMIDGVNDTDETHCQHWPCNNIYTRCDHYGIWNCVNGVDEVDCPRNPCRPNSHPCILLSNATPTCLPVSRIDDGIIDCMNIADERAYCGSIRFDVDWAIHRCFKNSIDCAYTNSFCGNTTSYRFNEDIVYYCDNFPYKSEWRCPTCPVFLSNQALDRYSYLCGQETTFEVRVVEYFTLRNHLNYPIHDLTSKDDGITLTTTTTTNIVPIYLSSFHPIREVINYHSNIFCQRGIPIYSNDRRGTYCLCPPAYFGSQCQYQSQRLSLTLRFRTAEWRTLFTFVIMLIDNHTNIHSYDHIDYLSVRDCRKKFNIYLLYSTRPKLNNYTYHVRIDTFNKIKKQYYTSLYYPIHFPFLPVHRLAFQVDIPLEEGLVVPKKCPLKCLHGQCTQFLNVEKYFCRCFDGYSGTFCTEKNDCNCSPDAICIGTTQHRSICVCPHHKFGSRCYLNLTACRSNACSNDSQCIASDVKLSESDYFCLCPQGSIGSTCENREMKLEFHFDTTISVPQSMIIHFIFVPSRPTTSELGAIFEYAEPTQTSQIVKIGYSHNSATIYYASPFHLIFLQIHQQYYLALLQQNYTTLTNLSTNIIPQHHCQSVDQLFDEQILSLSRWHRAKYYHLPCQNHSNLTCFYDNDYFMCLCDVDRHANCFRFDYDRIYNCFGYNYCQNDGQCYQDNNTCPTSSSCFCKECYFGSQCQFTSTGFGLSLDDILSYSIWPNISLSQQPIIIKLSTSITILMFILSIINTALSVITFRTKKSLNVGCGVYLLAAAIMSLLTIMMFTLKCLFLVLSQMSFITNKSFLLINCILMDMIVKSLLAIGDWLNACVAVERVMTAYIGVTFDKKKSKRCAKWIIAGICLFTLASYIVDPVHRQLLEDNEEQRTWCVVRYSSAIQRFIIFINIIHFIVPLGINILSVLIIIVLVARQKSTANSQETYGEHLMKQYHQHKHRLFSSIVLVMIAMPRLIISFLSECMKSGRNPGLYVAGYFLSFIPPLLGFILFVLPSKFYRTQFKDATIAIKTTMERRFRHQDI